MNSNPIGVFDSGVGGISVLKELVNLMPNENFIYYGDSANAPYGVKSFDEVQRLTLATAAKLMDMKCKCLVIACNTATAAAVKELRRLYPDVPVIGIEPALKPAVLAKENGRVLVIATSVTLHEEKFHRLMLQYKDHASITTMPAPGIVEFVEKGITDGPELEGYLRELFSDYIDNPPDSLVLGCTHYPFVKDAIDRLFEGRTYIVDGGNGTARETLRQLAAHDLMAEDSAVGNVRIFNSREDMIPLCRQLLDR